MVIYDTDNAGSAGGIEIIADGTILESIIFENVLISGFTDGSALKLEAKNSGGVTYCSFYDVRIRHAKIGIQIVEDGTSFTNSNSFYHGAISGGGFDYVLLVQGGNNNVFNATVLEPYTSTYGHVVVEAGQIIGNEIRIEGASQPTDTPLIQFDSGTSQSRLSGLYSGGLTIDQGDNFINLKSGKSLDYKYASDNLFVNAALLGVESNSIPFWEVSSGVTVESEPYTILQDQNTLKITVPAGQSSYLRPSTTYLPESLSPEVYDTVNFGAYIKASQADLVTTTCKAPAGIATGIFHPGDDEWHMIGMTSLVDKTTSYDPKFIIDNTSGTSSVVIYLTTPTLTFGIQPNNLNAAPLSTKGGIITGTVTNGMISVDTVPTGFLTLPKEGNLFEINGTNTIARINHSGADKFPKGTVITLLFNNAGTGVSNSAYINLIAGFSSIVNGSLTLVSNGNGTWREVNRNT